MNNIQLIKMLAVNVCHDPQWLESTYGGRLIEAIYNTLSHENGDAILEKAGMGLWSDPHDLDAANLVVELTEDMATSGLVPLSPHHSVRATLFFIPVTFMTGDHPMLAHIREPLAPIGNSLHEHGLVGPKARITLSPYLYSEHDLQSWATLFRVLNALTDDLPQRLYTTHDVLAAHTMHLRFLAGIVTNNDYIAWDVENWLSDGLESGESQEWREHVQKLLCTISPKIAVHLPSTRWETSEITINYCHWDAIEAAAHHVEATHAQITWSAQPMGWDVKVKHAESGASHFWPTINRAQWDTFCAIMRALRAASVHQFVIDDGPGDVEES